MTLTTQPYNELLDLPAWRGQRVERFTFELFNGVTGERLGTVRPSRDSDAPQVSHDVSRKITRQLRLFLDDADVAAINILTDRIAPYMHVGGVAYPLGKYVFTDNELSRSTYGERGPHTLLDYSFIVDQEIESGFSSTDHVDVAVYDLLREFAFDQVNIEPTQFNAVGAFSPGSRRGQILDAYITQGDYFPPWFNHDGNFQMIRSFEPAEQIPTFDFDTYQRIHRDSIKFTSDVISAPNKFIIVSNSGDADTAEIVGTYEVPPTAPYSISQRGFAITKTENLQVEDSAQAEAVARNMGIRDTIYERIAFETPLDPRHDAYDVLRFGGENWLELAWSMSLVAGGTMQHLARKAYRATR